MKHTCFENSIPLDVCKEIKEFFDSHPELQVHKPNNPDVIKINSKLTSVFILHFFDYFI